MIESDWGMLFSEIRQRFTELSSSESRQEKFLSHVRNLGAWENDPMDYPDADADFPEYVYVSYAVCHTDCGTRELIVEGSTQECQTCGRLMYRVETHKYIRSPEQETHSSDI
ncbi:hypothetical protein [Pleomorphomonas sp. PLEO]|uniref:hypothetical protein n=1 Tax=Pleomorphomonas sp. PLEO TaxID=3239306 RepID=UPI00351E9397